MSKNKSLSLDIIVKMLKDQIRTIENNCMKEILYEYNSSKVRDQLLKKNITETEFYVIDTILHKAENIQTEIIIKGE